MQYLTYQEYMDIGGELSETAFKRNIMRACTMIDNATHCRIWVMRKTPAEVKELCRDITEYLAENSVTRAPVASQSQSAGPVSESITYTVKTKEEQANDIDNMICDYLLSVSDDSGTPLLYRGCSG